MLWKSLLVLGIALAQGSIDDRIGKLRSMPDDHRAVMTKQLALEIRNLPAGADRLQKAEGLANLSTEGDFGRDTLQEVTTTLAEAVKTANAEKGITEFAYDQLAALFRYEHMKIGLENAEFKAALAKLDATDAERAKADFTLTDLQGKTWKLSSLKGKVVLVNFWATILPSRP